MKYKQTKASNFDYRFAFASEQIAPYAKIKGLLSERNIQSKKLQQKISNSSWCCVVLMFFLIPYNHSLKDNIPNN